MMGMSRGFIDGPEPIFRRCASVLPACSAKMLGSDGSARPCAVKTVCYSNKLALDSTGPDAAIAAQHLKKGAQRADSSQSSRQRASPSAVSGHSKSQRPDGKMALVIVTE